MSLTLKKILAPVAFTSLIALVSMSSAQVAPSAATAGKAATAPTDALDRTTPSGTVFGFLRAAADGNYGIASQYLQMSPARRQGEGEQIAAKLKYVMDNALAGSLRRVSTAPEGTPQEGVPLDRQNLGTMSSGDVEVQLELVRVNDASAGKIWLISSDTLTKVPELYAQAEARQVERHLPRVLVKYEIAGMPIWQWLGLLAAVPVAAALGWLVVALLEFPLGWWARRAAQIDIANWRTVSGPGWLLAATVVHRILSSYLRMPLLQRHYYGQVVGVLVIIAANWIFWRVLRWFLHRVRIRALSRGHSGTGSVILLGERLVKAGVIILAAFAVLGSLGFNMSTALAGLGIGGIAIGFGAQQTIANLFGGLSVLGDEVIRVGDVCTFGDRTGVVEDIGLRSTRVRTEERTLLAIPNGTVATINVENLSRRDKILFKTSIKLRAETKADHLRYVLAEIRRLLYSHPKIESNNVRVRLIDIANNTPTVEVVAYILTRDFGEFAAVREDLLLRILGIAEDAGTGLAMPAQTLYLGRDPGLHKEKAEMATQKIAEMRDEKKLPFPDFHEDDISSFRGSINYPEDESAVRSHPRDPGQ
ncbi:MAG TPA: mechanosensitive ion channel domain-containing protein [Candidatus Sulfotelmatobacter sp.]|nr:mechanosensitive ion channel domain-containing protein [Candidatus Sulfotelmatobacter sp.]